MASQPTTGGVEVIPLSHRILGMSAFRVALLFAVILVTWNGQAGIHQPDVVTWGAYGAVAVAGLGALAVHNVRWAVRWFGSSLLVDSVFLQLWHERLGHGTQIDALVAALLVTVCLLASYRTGLKLAVWQSLLMMLSWRSEESGLLPAAAGMTGTDRAHTCLVDMAMLWLVVLTTSVASSINERELRRRRHDAEVLRGLAFDLLGDHTEDAVLDRMCSFLTSELLIGRVAIIRQELTPGGLRLSLMGGAGLTKAERTSMSDSALLDLTRRRADSVMALRLDPGRDRYLNALLPGASRVVCTPLRQGDGLVVAVLEFPSASRKGRVERRIISSAAQACATSGLALARAELLAASQREARVDGLTGLANRRSFDQILAQEIDRSGREGSQMSLVLTDVDFFKKVNDVYGHQIGDQVLQVVGATLAQATGVGQTACRYGGEEFAIIAPAQDAAEVAELAERIRLAIMQVEEPVAITMSFGVATFPGDARSVDELILAADAALLSAKENGRNQVVVATTDMTSVVSQRHRDSTEVIDPQKA